MSDRDQAMLDAVYLLHDHGAGPFHERLFLAAGRLFPDTLHSLDLWRKADGAYQSAIDIDYGADEVFIMQKVGELVPMQHPCYEYIAGGGRRPVILADFSSHRQFRRTDLYEIAFRPIDVRHQLSIPLVTDTHVGGLTLNRRGRRPFTEEDVFVAAQFARFVVQAHRTQEVLAEALVQRPVAESRDHLPLRRAGLSRREVEVLEWMAQGKRDREIAIILGISYRTVTNHVRAILTKLKVETRTAAATAMQRIQAGQMGMFRSRTGADHHGTRPGGKMSSPTHTQDRREGAASAPS